MISTTMTTIGAAVLSPLSVTAAGTLPADVTAFLARREQCDHWAGEEPYDRARLNEIAAAMRRLRCDTLDMTEQRLRRLYRQNPVVLTLLNRDDE